VIECCVREINLKNRVNFVIHDVIHYGEANILLERSLQITKMASAIKDNCFVVPYDIKNG